MPASKNIQKSTPQKSMQKHIRHIPMRRCVLCRSSHAQTELIRFYKDPSGSWRLDQFHLGKLAKLDLTQETIQKTTKPSGRGAWICHNNSDNHCHHPKKLAYFFKKQAEEIEEILQKYTIQDESTGTEASQDASQSDLSKETQFHSGGMNV